MWGVPKAGDRAVYRAHGVQKGWRASCIYLQWEAGSPLNSSQQAVGGFWVWSWLEAWPGSCGGMRSKEKMVPPSPSPSP